MIFSQKAGFCVVINFIIKKVVTLPPSFFALSKNKPNSRSSQIHNSFTRDELNYRYFWRILLEISRISFLQNTFQWLLTWNYIILSILCFQIGLIQTFLNNILDSQWVSQKFWNTVSLHLLKVVSFKTSGLKTLF